MLISTSSAAFPGLWLATRWPFGGVRLLEGSSVPGAVLDHPGRVGTRLAPDTAVPVASGRRCCRFRRPPWARGDLDRLLAVGRHGGAVVAILAEVDDPEIDLQLDPPRAGSNTVTFGAPYGTRTDFGLKGLKKRFAGPFRARQPLPLFCRWEFYAVRNHLKSLRSNNCNAIEG